MEETEGIKEVEEKRKERQQKEKWLMDQTPYKLFKTKQKYFLFLMELGSKNILLALDAIKIDKTLFIRQH